MSLDNNVAIDSAGEAVARQPRIALPQSRFGKAKGAKARTSARTTRDHLGFRTRFVTVNTLLFVAFLITLGLPTAATKDPHNTVAVAVAIGIEAIALIGAAVAKKKETRDSVVDVTAVIFAALIAWQLATAVFNVAPEALFAAPGAVFAQIAEDHVEILTGIASSLTTVAQGFIAGTAAALVVGLPLGYHARSARSTERVVSFLSAIPPIVYIPYGIALLPTFHDASVMVIFLATFWPVLTSTLAGVNGVDTRIINSARVLNTSTLQTVFRVVLPASLPSIFNGLNIALCLSFILLTSAEMIAGNTGMGFYVNYYSSFGDFTRVLAGIIVIGTVVTAIGLVLAKIQKRLTHWK